MTEFHLPQPASAIFTVYDAAGRRVALAGRGSFDAGPGHVTWNGRDDSGKPASSGVYWYVLRTDDKRETRRMTLLQ